MSPRSEWMSLVLEKRESWQVAFTWSQAPCINLLMVKKAASRKASPNRGLFELCRVKKGRGLGKKRISPEWGFQMSARDIPASQQVHELCAHPQVTWISLKAQQGYLFLSWSLSAKWSLCFFSSPAQQTDLQWWWLLDVSVSSTGYLPLTFICIKRNFSLLQWTFMWPTRCWAQIWPAGFQTSLISLNKKKSNIYFISSLISSLTMFTFCYLGFK